MRSNATLTLRPVADTPKVISQLIHFAQLTSLHCRLRTSEVQVVGRNASGRARWWMEVYRFSLQFHQFCLKLRWMSSADLLARRVTSGARSILSLKGVMIRDSWKILAWFPLSLFLFTPKTQPFIAGFSRSKQ